MAHIQCTMFHHLASPVTANFIVTRNCNGNCSFCGVHHQSSSFCENAPVYQLFQIVDKLYEADILRINFFGGEPTIYPDLVQVMQYSKDLKFYNSIVTNGLHIPQNVLDFKGIVDALAISIHGLSAQHCKLAHVSPDTYNRILNNLDTYSQLGIPISVNMTVTPDNYTCIPEFVSSLLGRYPITSFAFNRFIPSPSVMQTDRKRFVMSIKQLNESLVKIDQAAEKYPSVLFRYAIHFPYCAISQTKLLKYVGSCGFGQNYISVDCDGNLQMCSYSNHILGNIFTDDLRIVWNNHKELISYRSQGWLPDVCKQCQHLSKCAAGCKMTGDESFTPDYLLQELGKL